MLTRRAILRLSAAGIVGAAGLSSYAFAIEPRLRLEVTRYALRPPGWPQLSRKFTIAALADIHACEPWMPVSRIEEIVALANALKPDMIVLLGDYVSAIRRFGTSKVPIADWTRALSRLSAPYGVHAVLGNHDWWDEIDEVRAGITASNINLMQNDARLVKPADGPAFWLAGLDDQIAFGRRRGGPADLPATLAKVTGEEPVIMLAHEPDIFARMPSRVSLTLAGHTHGGQVDLPLIGRPIVPSRYGQRYAYGHVVENGNHLLVSGGLGCTTVPVRFGVPPEIVLVEIG